MKHTLLLNSQLDDINEYTIRLQEPNFIVTKMDLNANTSHEVLLPTSITAKDNFTVSLHSSLSHEHIIIELEYENTTRLYCYTESLEYYMEKEIANMESIEYLNDCIAIKHSINCIPQFCIFDYKLMLLYLRTDKLVNTEVFENTDGCFVCSECEDCGHVTYIEYVDKEYEKYSDICFEISIQEIESITPYPQLGVIVIKGQDYYSDKKFISIIHWNTLNKLYPTVQHDYCEEEGWQDDYHYNDEESLDYSINLDENNLVHFTIFCDNAQTEYWWDLDGNLVGSTGNN